MGDTIRYYMRIFICVFLGAYGAYFQEEPDATGLTFDVGDHSASVEPPEMVVILGRKMPRKALSLFLCIRSVGNNDSQKSKQKKFHGYAGHVVP